MLDLLHGIKVIDTWGQRSSLIWKMRNDHPHSKGTFRKAHVMIDKGGKDMLSASSHDKHAAIPWLVPCMFPSFLTLMNVGQTQLLTVLISVLLILFYVCYRFPSKHGEYGTKVICYYKGGETYTQYSTKWILLP